MYRYIRIYVFNTDIGKLNMSIFFNLFFSVMYRAWVIQWDDNNSIMDGVPIFYKKNVSNTISDQIPSTVTSCIDSQNFNKARYGKLAF